MGNSSDQEIIKLLLQTKHIREKLYNIHGKTMKRAAAMDKTAKAKLTQVHETARLGNLLEQSARLHPRNTAGARGILSSVMQTRAAQATTCPKCGAKIVEGNAFCAACGGKLKT